VPQEVGLNLFISIDDPGNEVGADAVLVPTGGGGDQALEVNLVSLQEQAHQGLFIIRVGPHISEPENTVLGRHGSGVLRVMRGLSHGAEHRDKSDEGRAIPE
jgi:hypothetical protein